MTKLTRRNLLAAAGGGALGVALGGGYVLGHELDDDHAAGSTIVPFYGAQQGGIATPVQDRLVFGSFDVTTESRTELRDVLRTWSDAAARMTAGLQVGHPATEPLAPPIDTGEAVGLAPARLTATIGFGPELFAAGRFGFESLRPAKLEPLPALPGDSLEADRSGGDICVQACADDPQVAFHAVRNLARLGRGVVALRWIQLGFGRTSTTTSGEQTPRNLMGFKDGTNNIHGSDEDAMRSFVWVGDDEPQQWFRGGTYLVARRIRMRIETWDRSSLTDQEQTIGRFKQTGGPLSGGVEHAKVQLDSHAIPARAHIRLAAPATNSGERILRRGYSFTDGIDPDTGELDAGLFFIAFQRDPEKQFIAIQQRLGAGDALGEYIEHTGSALFAVPPGTQPGGFVGEGLF